MSQKRSTIFYSEKNSITEVAAYYFVLSLHDTSHAESVHYC